MKKLPVIRHIRWAILTLRFNYWWNTYGRMLGVFPNQSDIKFLDAVWKGEA